MSSPATTTLRASAFCGAALVFAMLLLLVLGGVGQEPLRALHTAADYSILLRSQPHVLCTVITIDNLFVVAYATLFFELRRVIVARGAASAHASAATAILLSVALFDLGENLHFLAMLRAVQSGFELSLAEIRLQHWASLLTFHLAHVGIFLLGLALPRDTRAELVVARICLASPLLGFLVYTTTPPLSQLLLYARFAYFVTTLIALGVIHGARPATARVRT